MFSYLESDVQPHAVTSLHKPAYTQGEGRLLEINEEWDWSRCIAPVCKCVRVNA